MRKLVFAEEWKGNPYTRWDVKIYELENDIFELAYYRDGYLHKTLQVYGSYVQSELDMYFGNNELIFNLCKRSSGNIIPGSIIMR